MLLSVARICPAYLLWLEGAPLSSFAVCYPAVNVILLVYVHAMFLFLHPHLHLNFKIIQLD